MKRALVSYRNALMVSQEENDTIGMSKASSGMASVYIARGEYPEAVQHLLFSTEHMDGKDVAFGERFGRIGEIYELLGDDNKADLYYQKAYVHMRSISASLHNFNYYRVMATVLNHLNSAQEAIANADSALMLGKIEVDLARIARVHFQKAKAYLSPPAI